MERRTSGRSMAVQDMTASCTSDLHSHLRNLCPSGHNEDPSKRLLACYTRHRQHKAQEVSNLEGRERLDCTPGRTSRNSHLGTDSPSRWDVRGYRR